MSALTFPLAEEQGEHLLIEDIGGESPPTQLTERRRRVDTRGQTVSTCLEHMAWEIRTMAPGDLLEVVTSDAASVDGVPAWARAHGHDVLESGGDGHTFQFLLRAG